MSNVPPTNPKDENVRNEMRRIGNAVNELIPMKWGFFVMVFPFGDNPDDRANYISNAKREDILNVMKEFLRKNGENPDMIGKHV